MAMQTACSIPTLPDMETARRLREVLEQAGFTTPRPLWLADLTEPELASNWAQGRQLAIGLRRTSAESAEAPSVLGTLTRLFVLGRPVPLADARDAVAPTELELWVGAGLLAIDGENVRATLQLAPVGKLVLAADPLWAGQVAADHVMHYGQSSHTLARLLIRRPFERALELGTGCGALALSAASFSGHVIATDVVPRAVHLAAFNARLNGIENVEFRQGNLFEPVGGMTFDLIFSNPPFVISPEKDFAYRDGGLPDDELGRTIIHEAPALLREGGFCQILCEWVHRQGRTWQDRLSSWAEGTGCDMWVLRAETRSVAQHAEQWADGLPGESPEELAARMNRWVEDFGSRGIEAISNGVVILRRRQGRNWFRWDDVPPVDTVGESIVQGFALRDFVEGVSTDELLQARLDVAPALRWDQQLKPTTDGWGMEEARIRLGEGLRFSAKANQYVLALLGRCRGETPLREILSELEESTEGELDREKALTIVRQMIKVGFLIPR